MLIIPVLNIYKSYSAKTTSLWAALPHLPLAIRTWADTNRAVSWSKKDTNAQKDKRKDDFTQSSKMKWKSIPKLLHERTHTNPRDYCILLNSKNSFKTVEWVIFTSLADPSASLFQSRAQTWEVLGSPPASGQSHHSILIGLYGIRKTCDMW